MATILEPATEAALNELLAKAEPALQKILGGVERMTAENERLKAEIAALQERLEIAEAPTFRERLRDEAFLLAKQREADNADAVRRVAVPRIWHTTPEEDADAIEAAIDSRKHPCITCRSPDDDLPLLASICRDWQSHQERLKQEDEALAKLKHAGLEEIRNMDWILAIKQYSGYPSELIQFVESLAGESDYDAVQVLVNRFYASPESSFADERV